MRKPIRFLTILTVLAMFVMTSMFLNGCAGPASNAPGAPAATASQDSPQTVAYKTLRTTADTYDATMKTMASLYKQGIINADTKAKAIQYATVFRTAYGKAIDVLETGGTPSVAAVSSALTDLLQFLQPYLTQGGKA